MTNCTDNIAIFALEGSHAYGEKVATALGLSLAPLEERYFSDGEGKVRPLQSVRGKYIHVIHSLYNDETQSVNDKLCRLLFFISTLKDAGAAHITVHAPYLCYARKDRKTKDRDPVTTRYVAMLFEAAGTDRLVTIDAHNLQAFQNAFRCPTEHLETKCLFAGHFAALLKDEDITIISPDTGGLKRAEKFARELGQHNQKEIPVCFLEKTRSQDIVSGTSFIHGNIQGRHSAIIYDDMIASGTTMQRAARACREKGIEKIYAAATHGLFTGEADKIFADPLFDGVVTTNTIESEPLHGAAFKEKLSIIDSTPFLAAAIWQLHNNGTICDLNKKGV